MGSVINLDNFGGDLPDVLTNTGQGGLLSTGYLHDEPAVAAIEADETPQFVATNSKNGVTIERGNQTDTIRPGSGYRTIAVLTDRRLIVLVGDSDGDSRLTVPLVEVERVDIETGLRQGRLTFVRAGTATWHLYCGTDGLADIADYLTAASQAWIRLENTVDAVKQQLVAATEHRDAGEYDAALDAVDDAVEAVEEASGVATRAAVERPGDAMIRRLDSVRERCFETLAEVRLGRARDIVDSAEDHWRNGDYEAAYETYDRARSEYDAVSALPDRYVDTAAAESERDRLDRVVGQLEKSPLRRAVAADNEAAAADDPATAAERWADALEQYRTLLELDWGADERRFAGDPEKIRDRLATVAERLTAARRSVATEAVQAGDWYADAGNYETALDEYARAQEAYDAAIETARDCYPDAVDHLEADRDALRQRVDRARAAADGERVTDRIEDDVEPTYDVDATIGRPENGGDVDPSELADVAVPGASDSLRPAANALGRLDRSALVDAVVEVLAETKWEPTAVEPDAEYDVLATEPGADATMGVVVRRATDGPLGADAVEQCCSIEQAAAIDSVMLATDGRVPDDVAAVASDRGVDVMDVECLAGVIEAQGIALDRASKRVSED